MGSFFVRNIPLVQKLPEFREILVPLYRPKREFSQQSETGNLQKEEHKMSWNNIIFICMYLRLIRTGCPLGPWSPCSPGSPMPPLKPLFPGGPLWPRRPCSPWMDEQMSKWVRIIQGKLNIYFSNHVILIVISCSLTGISVQFLYFVKPFINLRFAFTFGPMLPCSPGSPGTPVLPLEPALPGRPASPSSPCSP